VADLLLQLRTDSGRQDGSTVHVSIPADVLHVGTAGEPPICDGPPLAHVKPSGPAPEKAVELDRFFWIQLTKDDVFVELKCGDILVLVGFHLIQKVDKSPEEPAGGNWLWSTYWWDDLDRTRRHLALPMRGAGRSAAAWTSYVVEATYRSDQPIFNPWKSAETPGSNCAFCHNHAVFPLELVEPAGAGPLTPVPGKMGADFIYAGPKKMQKQ